MRELIGKKVYGRLGQSKGMVGEIVGVEEKEVNLIGFIHTEISYVIKIVGFEMSFPKGADGGKFDGRWESERQNKKMLVGLEYRIGKSEDNKFMSGEFDMKLKE